MSYREKSREVLEREVAVLKATVDRMAVELSTEVAKRMAEAQRADELERRAGRTRVRGIAGWLLSYVGAGAFGVACAFGLLALGVRSCEEALPAEAGGVVTDRYHRPAYTTTQCTTVGMNTTCVPIIHPESWSIRVAHDGHERVDSVSEEYWERVAVGDWVGPRE